MLCLLCGPTLTIIRDHWEDHTLTICAFVGRVLFKHCLGSSWLSCQEDATCKQYRIMFVFLYLTYFTHYDNLFIMWSLLSSSASVCFSEHTSFLFYLPSQIQYWFFIVTCHTFWYLFSRILSGIFFFLLLYKLWDFKSIQNNTTSII